VGAGRAGTDIPVAVGASWVEGFAMPGCAASGTPMDLAKLRSAAWNASALWKRCSGALEMAIIMMSFKSSGTPATISMGATGFCSRCAAMIE
jgi:hypothetical protein